MPAGPGGTRECYIPPMRWIGRLGALWGTIGVLGLLGVAVARLSPIAAEALQSDLAGWQWGLVAVVCVGMAYAEGYRGFQCRFSPRTAARIRRLRDRPDVLHSLLAPLFAMGFFHARRRTKITAWTLSLGILVLVLTVQRMDQPWRGIVDAGVVVGLSWGAVSLVWSIVEAWTRPDYSVSPEVP